MKWFIYRFDWNVTKQKYDKYPCPLDGRQVRVDIAEVWQSDRSYVERCLDCLPQSGAGCYALGMKPEPGETYFFLDLDHCVVDGNLDAAATALATPFLAAGCYFEGTSSQTGVHLIGRYHGELPPHDHKRPGVHTYEFYTDSQGVALNRQHHTGSWEVDCTAILHNILPVHFKQRVQAQQMLEFHWDRPRDDWDGITDDDQLIAKAIASQGSVAARFGNGTTFKQLWEGQCSESGHTEADLALASHLAFWTGCHGDRIERLMRRSGLMREKWDSHRTYLRELTIERACATTKNVYKAIRVAVPQMIAQVQGSDVDWYARTRELCDEIYAISNLKDLVEVFMPTLGAMSIPVIYGEQIVDALQKRLKVFNVSMSVAKLRTVVNPPRTALVANNVVVPDWFANICYVAKGDRFMDVGSGSQMSADGLRMQYAKEMPFKPNGDREDVVKYARERWPTPVVDDVLYRPDQPAYFAQAGLKYANLFNPATFPEVTTPSAECVQCIELFQEHMHQMCGKRDEVYLSLMHWLAHNVQFPGRKIRWSPLLKGVQGDGKSIVIDLLLATMGGVANVKQTSNSNLHNKGGFTDWATGKAVNVIEEIRLTGKEKHDLFNAMKIFIADTLADVNMKGKVSTFSFFNYTNHWANSNYEDAVPTDNKDRRWMIVFSPFLSIEDAVAAKGMRSTDELVAQFKRIGSSMRGEPGAWRGWLLGTDLSGFDPDGRAPYTDEKAVMSALSEDPVEQLVRDVIENGGPGISENVFASSMVRRALKIRAQLEDLQLPGTSAWHSMLTRVGFRPWPKAVKISGSSLQLWVRQNFHADQDKLVEILKNTWPTA